MPEAAGGNEVSEVQRYKLEEGKMGCGGRRVVSAAEGEAGGDRTEGDVRSSVRRRG